MLIRAVSLCTLLSWSFGGYLLAGYISWCKKNRQPRLLIFGGISETRSGRLRLRFREGHIYEPRNKAPLGFYIPLYRYGGPEIAVRWDQRHNIHRFEAVRWKLLNFMKNRVHRLVVEHNWEMLRHSQQRHKQPITGWDNRGNPVSLTISRSKSSYTNEMEFSIGEEHPEAEDGDLLTKMAIGSMGAGGDQEILDRYYMLQAWEALYERRLDRINMAIGHLLTRLRGKTMQQAARAFHARINGREYVISPMSMSRSNDDISLWPDPRNHALSVDLDTIEGKKLLKEKCCEWER